jgi:hypothetical protein
MIKAYGIAKSHDKVQNGGSRGMELQKPMTRFNGGSRGFA